MLRCSLSLSLPLRHENPPVFYTLKPQQQHKASSLQFSPTQSLTTRLSSKHPSFRCSCLLNSVKSEDDELGRLLALLPERMRRRVSEHPELNQLIEVVMDLGRQPLARFPSGDFVLSDEPISVEDIEHAKSQVGDFSIDNRAGISRTLHRISAIRNRKGAIIGLTCRVGRAITGSANLLQDLIQDGASLLLIGPPGVGKTTIIREIARMLANDFKKRVMIVDTSNEIGGDGDIPHSGIGNARRMQVPDSDMQHKVLIEAVENHMPQVIVIDEIGTKLEATAATTIAQRGIQLVATAHGITIENLIMNPSLEMLVGGIESVTLGDEEANRRRGQKTVLERKGPSTFSCAVEIVSKTELRIHRSLEATVDAILSGRNPYVDVRKIRSEGVEKSVQSASCCNILGEQNEVLEDVSDTYDINNDINKFASELSPFDEDTSVNRAPLFLYVYGILEATVMQGINQLKLDAAVQLTDNISEADAFLALHSKLKKNSRIQAVAKSHDLPIYVTKTSSLVQITKAIRTLVNDHTEEVMEFQPEEKVNISEKADALEEARIAVQEIVIPKGQAVELLPRSPHIISLQLDFIKKYQLEVERLGAEPNVRLRILPLHSIGKEYVNMDGAVDSDSECDELISATDESNGSPYIIDRLPLLPE